MRNRFAYPMGSISSGTMRSEDLIPTFCAELESQARQPGIVSAKTRKAHVALVREIEARIGANDEEYFESEDANDDLSSLFDALECYAAPYFYFGAHPGDGADYGFWLSESWDEDFTRVNSGIYHKTSRICHPEDLDKSNPPNSLLVEDLNDVPCWFRGEVAEVNDHGNVTLYVKTSRGLREVWSVV